MNRSIGATLLFIGLFTLAFSTVMYIQPAVRLSMQSIVEEEEVMPEGMTTEVRESKEGEVPIIVQLDIDPMSISTMSIQSRTSRTMSLVQPLAINYNFTVEQEKVQHLSLFGAVAGTIPRQNKQELISHPHVKSIARDRTIKVPDGLNEKYLKPEEVVERLSLEELWEEGKGEGINIAVIDTGVDSDYAEVNELWSVSDYPVEDDFGHGTVCADIINQTAPEADVYSVRAMDQYGVGSTSDVMSAMGKAVEEIEPPLILNISLGSAPSEYSPISNASLIASKYKDAYIVSASGNNGENIVSSPAQSKYTISVGAINTENEKTEYSNYGPEITTVSYGDRVVNWLGSERESSGTSWATPHVVGLLASKISTAQQPTNVDMETLIKRGSMDIGPEGRDTFYGHGLLTGNRLAEAETPYGRGYDDYYPYIISLSLLSLIGGVTLISRG